jgi:two-component system, NtrC family, sensor histidine kinase KinB
MTLARRIWLLVLPAILLPALIGTAGVVLLDNLGRRSEEIIRENYVSLGAMANLHSHLTDAERTVLFAVIQGDKLHPDVGRAFRECIARARAECQAELGNITIPGEQAEAEALAASIEEVAKRGEVLLAAPATERDKFYVEPQTGFQPAVTSAWRHMSNIRAMNEAAMYEADLASRSTARRSITALAVSVGIAFVLTLLLSWWLQRTILKPIETVTIAATAIGSGQLHLVVPEAGPSEISQLAKAFNTMTQKLRAYRQTDSERLNRARQTAQATIDSFPDPVVVIDMIGRVEVANPMAQRIFGVRPPRDGEPDVIWTPPESLRQPVEEALRQQRVIVRENFDDAVTFRLDNEDGIYLPQVRPIRSPEGELLGAAVVLNDVTRFRLMDKLKSDWVATVSHELKTPLTSVRLAVHVLLEEVVGPLEAKQVELLIEARESTERLMKLIEHLLSLAKLEEGHEPLNLQPFDPAELLRSAVDECAARAEDKHIEITIETTILTPDTKVQVDQTRFLSALNNLLDNAITYTEPGGHVTLSATSQGDNVTLTITDTGIGIPPEHLPHIFDRFFRVPESHQGGTGLGLAIVREIIEAHGGTITCQSSPGRGTVFVIHLKSAKFIVQNAK